MSKQATLALIPIDVKVVSDAVDCFNKTRSRRSIYYLGLVHQISLSNLACEYASINTSYEIIRTPGGSN